MPRPGRVAAGTAQRTSRRRGPNPTPSAHACWRRSRSLPALHGTLSCATEAACRLRNRGAHRRLARRRSRAGFVYATSAARGHEGSAMANCSVPIRNAIRAGAAWAAITPICHPRESTPRSCVRPTGSRRTSALARPRSCAGAARDDSPWWGGWTAAATIAALGSASSTGATGIRIPGTR